MKKDQKDVLDIFNNLKKLLDSKPPMDEMFEEVRMMKFKIRPISGDISLLYFKDTRIIETLWSLGKLDEIFQKEFNNLTKTQKDVMFRIFDKFYQQFQEELNSSSAAKIGKKTDLSQVIEMEIFKELPAKKKVN